MAEGCDDIFDQGKVITICDQACGTGGMLSTAYSYIKQLNPSADVRLFGQEYMGVSYAMGVAEMLIKGQDAENFRHADTFKDDCFPDIDMRFMIENPPFGTPWSGKDAKAGQEEAVKAEFTKGLNGRWGAGLPKGDDSQMIFLQSAISKMDKKIGRAAIIENGSPLFSGGTASGESQIRRWLLENDLIEAIIAMPTDLFYNTGIATYVWILSKNKRDERKGKVQLIDATGIYHKLRKPMGDKKNEFTKEDRAVITKLYSDFIENDLVQIYENTQFIYREYTVMQPLQRSYGVSLDRIQNMMDKNSLSNIYDEAKVFEFENAVELSDKDKKKLEEFYNNRPVYDKVIEVLKENVSNEEFMNPNMFTSIIHTLLSNAVPERKDLKKIVEKVVDGLSMMDKKAEIQLDKKGNTIFDKETKTSEIVKWDEGIDEYMNREVLPYTPDAIAFFEEDLSKKKPVIKTGAEIPFTKYFYKYQIPEDSSELARQFLDTEKMVDERIKRLFGKN